MGAEGTRDVRGGGGDTIAAIATAPGEGAVGIVRISGPAAVAILARVTGRAAARFRPRELVLCEVREPDGGARLDEVLAVHMPAPRSYTGEDVVELQGHGGAANLGRVLDAVLRAGARAAAPGEFTRRAFMHGRLDLTQVEAVAQVIGASSARAHAVAQAQLGGALGARLRGLRARVVAALAEVEATIDFPDEASDAAIGAVLADELGALRHALAALAASHREGRVLGEGLVVALVGAPNVGKSSLLNALAGVERALVSPVPGTTRDWLEARVVWDGVAVTLVDTAGVEDRLASTRAGAGEVTALEQRGVALGQARAAHAEVVVDVRAPGVAGAGDGRAAAQLVVWNKVDLAPAPAGVLGVSALTGAGLEALRAAILAAAGASPGVASEASDVIVSARQAQAIGAAAEALSAGAAALAARHAVELVAADLRAALTALDAALGVGVSDEVLDRVFARFCIGK